MVKKSKIVFLSLFCFISSAILIPVKTQDICQGETDRIYSICRMYENKLHKDAWDKLIESINKDIILRMEFFSNDSVELKKLKPYIKPLFRLSKDAQYYYWGDNICKYFEYDTTKCEFVAGFYRNDTLLFYITRPYRYCNTLTHYFPPCTSEYTFKQYFYKELRTEHCTYPKFIVEKDTVCGFYLDRFSYVFKIEKNVMYIYHYNNKKEFTWSSNVDSVIDNQIHTGTIRNYAKECSTYEPSPWWHFWDWEIFELKE